MACQEVSHHTRGAQGSRKGCPSSAYPEIGHLGGEVGQGVGSPRTNLDLALHKSSGLALPWFPFLCASQRGTAPEGRASTGSLPCSGEANTLHDDPPGLVCPLLILPPGP